MSFCVYTIFNECNGKIYVGKTGNFARRRQRHIYAALGQASEKKFYIHRAMAKHGVENFTFSILQEFVDEERCNEAEKYWISFFNSKNPKLGYNLTEGGEGNSGRIISDETRLKMSESHKGAKNYLFGKTIPEETREKFSKAKIGRYEGSNNPNSKLGNSDIVDIRNLRQQGWLLRELAAKYDVGTTIISDICSGKAWSKK